jgi:hypothetical protein
VDVIAEVGLAGDEVRGEGIGSVGRWEQCIPEGIALFLEVFDTVNGWYRVSVGMMVLDCPPDVAVVVLGESACVIVVSGMRDRNAIACSGSGRGHMVPHWGLRCRGWGAWRASI